MTGHLIKLSQIENIKLSIHLQIRTAIYQCNWWIASTTWIQFTFYHHRAAIFTLR